MVIIFCVIWFFLYAGMKLLANPLTPANRLINISFVVTGVLMLIVWKVYDLPLFAGDEKP